MVLELNANAGLDYNNALFLATASELAYGDDKDAFTRQLGLTGEFCTTDNTQVFVGNDQTNLVLAFRGSQPLVTAEGVSEMGIRDWLFTDGSIKLTPPAGKLKGDFDALGGADGLFHRGFLAALNAVWPKVLARLKADEANSDRQVWVTGHSLGGALATLAAVPLDRLAYDVHGVYTFAAPMVCNHAAATHFDLEFPDKIQRFVFQDDIVPALPVFGLPNQYDRVQTLVPLSRGDETEVPALRRNLNKFIELARSLSANFVQLLMQEIDNRAAAHSLSKSYIPAIKRNIPKE